MKQQENLAETPVKKDAKEKNSLQKCAIEHEAHDDEMEGIRKLTRDYQLEENAPLTMKVLYHELQNFEKELSIHAKIEDELLFPKAVELEKEALRRIRKQIQTH